jgi:rod shape-determining protein MreC
MRNILLLFARYGAHILFIGIEIFCFFLIVNYNQTQKDIYLNSIGLLNGKINQRVDKLSDYLYLQEVNDSLISENAKLLEQIINASSNNQKTVFLQDSVLKEFKIIPSAICNKTINLKNNYITLCKGESSGIRKDMGVISEKGIVGMVRSTSKDFSIVLPIINVLSRTSVAIKNKAYFGTMLWRDTHPLYVTVEEIPKHADLGVGDTIITSGFSSVFPKGIEIGKITNFSVEPGSANYTIDVTLNNDLSKIEYVYVIDYVNRFQKDSLQKTIIDE